MTEVELAKKFIEFFADGYEIYKEVPASGIVDIVAVCDPITIAIEVKTRLSFEVIEQAVKNKHFFNYNYVAVPKPKYGTFAYRVCQQFGIGVLAYDKNINKVKQTVRPKLLRKVHRPKLADYMKRSIAGSQNDRVTAFSNTVDEMSRYIRRNPGCTLDECLKNIPYHWSTFSSAKACVRQWISKEVITDFKLEGKVLVLNDSYAGTQ